MVSEMLILENITYHEVLGTQALQGFYKHTLKQPLKYKIWIQYQ